jgi:hypothetical protein
VTQDQYLDVLAAEDRANNTSHAKMRVAIS